MTRIEPLSKREAHPLVRWTFGASRRDLGRDVDPVGVYAYAPRLLIGYGAFEKATAKEHRVEERLKALAETKAAAIVNCEFCCDIASSIAREAGITEAQLLALPRYRESDLFTEREKVALDFTVAVMRTPVEVTDELFARMQDHFTEEQLVEITALLTVVNLDRFNAAFRIGSAGFSEGMVCVLPDRPTADLRS